MNTDSRSPPIRTSPRPPPSMRTPPLNPCPNDLQMDWDYESLSTKHEGSPQQEVESSTEPPCDDKLRTPPTSNGNEGPANDNDTPMKAPKKTQTYSLQGHQIHLQQQDAPNIGPADSNTKKSGNPRSNKGFHKPHENAYCSILDDEYSSCLRGLLDVDFPVMTTVWKSKELPTVLPASQTYTPCLEKRSTIYLNTEFSHQLFQKCESESTILLSNAC